MRTGGTTLRFTLARTVNLVAVSSGPRPTGPDALPADVRLIDLATAGELAEIAASLEAAPEPDATAPSTDPADAAGLDGLIACAEARLLAIRARSSPRGS